MSLPKMRTKEDAIQEQADLIMNGGERGFVRALLSNMTGSATRGLPETDDHDKLAGDAAREFQRSDYSGAMEAVESLALIVDYYKNLAEQYLQNLNDYAISTDEYGNVDNYPFTLMDSGNEVIGRVEVLHMDEQDKRTLWDGYIRPHLQFATKSEKEWIAKEFAEFFENSNESDA